MSEHAPEFYRYPAPSVAPLSARVTGTVIYGLIFLLAFSLIPADALNPTSAKFIFVIGAIGVWRYTWSFTHLSRALYYRGVIFPQLREKADAIGQERKIPHLYILVTSYRMAADVTARAYQALFDDVIRYGVPTTVFAAVTDEADEALIEDIFVGCKPPANINLHLFQQDGTGKRTAMADLLRGISRDMPHHDAVVAFMDGDSILLPGTLEKTLPFFLMEQNLGAVTVDSRGHMTEGSNLAKEWFDLRFAQRHLLMSSLSLSKRLLVLTGRLSFIRANVSVQSDFIDVVENDRIDHWRYGQFKFLTGDDKSTWFYLLKKGMDMRYLPDVQVRSLEDMPSGGFFRSTSALMRRWFGNMLRNNGRAIALGPKSMPLFFWWCLIDQRLSIWTSLTGPAFALLGTIAISPEFLFSYLAWILLTRFVLALITGFYRGRGFSPYFPPLLYFTQVVGSLVKVYVSFRLNKQSWTRQKISSGAQRPLLAFWHDLWDNAFQWASISALLYAAGLSVNVFALPSDVEFKAFFVDEPKQKALSRTVIYPAPGSNSDRLQDAIDQLKAGDTLYLGRGTYHIDRPLSLSADNIAIRGLDRERTLLTASFKGTDMAMIKVGPQDRQIKTVCVSLTSAAVRDDFSLVVDQDSPFNKNDFVIVEVGNDETFLNRIGSNTWRKQYPTLRRTMSRVVSSDGERLYLARPVGTHFPAGSKVCSVAMTRDVEISDLTLVYGAESAPDALDYTNTHSDQSVDGIALQYAAFTGIHDVTIVNAGRHPLHLDGVYGTRVSDVELTGALNKGPDGNGYFRVARSYYGQFDNIDVSGLRHIAVQWSSHDNVFSNISSDTDINFHGGFTHHNVFRESCVRVRDGHKWPNVYRTPNDASWAPPDGTNNTVEDEQCLTM